MSKIKNDNLANLQVLVCGEVVQFNIEGIAEVASADVFNTLLTLKGYHEVKEASDARIENIIVPIVEEPKAEEAPKEEEVKVEEAPKEEEVKVEAPKEEVKVEEAPKVETKAKAEGKAKK